MVGNIMKVITEWYSSNSLRTVIVNRDSCDYVYNDVIFRQSSMTWKLGESQAWCAIGRVAQAGLW